MYPHQKEIIIHREMPKRDFLQIKDENWMELNKKLGPYALQLYLYLADNKDGFNLALSQQAAEDEAGIAKTTFHKYVNLMIDEGYLVHRCGNTYDFYETPHKQEVNEVERSSCGELIESQQEQQSLSCESPSPSDNSKPPQPNKEINNRYFTDNTEIITDGLCLREEESKSEVEEEGFNF